MMYAILDEATLAKTIFNKVSEIEIPVKLTNPDDDAEFPVIVMQPPISRPIYMGAAWNISVTLEVWGNMYYDPFGEKKETADYFTDLKAKMLELNFQCVNQTPAFKDVVTSKIRYGGNFEARWNATNNTFERNR